MPKFVQVALQWIVQVVQSTRAHESVGSTFGYIDFLNLSITSYHARQEHISEGCKRAFSKLTIPLVRIRWRQYKEQRSVFLFFERPPVDTIQVWSLIEFES